jgi:hypothetical protein
MKKSQLILILLFTCSFNVNTFQKKKLTYQNIAILADLSSRIHSQKYPLKDIVEIHNLIQYFRNSCVKPSKKIGDRSCLSFSLFTASNPIYIDVDSFKNNISEKQRFVNSTGNYLKNGLDYRLVSFENHIKSAYRNVDNPGLDLISILVDKIEKGNILKKGYKINDGFETTEISFDNHIYLFTDGYLEYSRIAKQQNNQFYFGESEIKKIRKYCTVNNVDVETALVQVKSLGLPAVKIKNNQNLHLHVFETHERDKDIKYQTYKYPIGIRDNEILEAIWKKWAIESGFKSFEWRKY